MTALDDALWPRAALPRRPMLGAVLDALTSERDHRRFDAQPSVLLRTGVTSVKATGLGVALWAREEYGWDFAWTTADPAEAYELLQARDLIPMEYVGRFVCERCGGSGSVPVAELGVGWNAACAYCADGHRPHPPTVAALASWASLGFAASDDGAPGILGAEELMGELSPRAIIRWRVTPVADIPTDFFRNESTRRLNAAGFGWSGGTGHRTLYVPPLGLVTP